MDTNVARAGRTGASLAQDVVTQLQAKNAFLANLAVFKTGHAQTGSLLDITA